MEAKRKPISEIFSSNLRRLLEEKGATQAELSRHMGVSTPTVNNWCKGKITPLLGKLDALCAFFVCEPSDLLLEQVSERAVDVAESIDIYDYSKRQNKQERHDSGLTAEELKEMDDICKLSTADPERAHRLIRGKSPEIVVKWLIQTTNKVHDSNLLVLVADYLMSDERGKENIRETAAREHERNSNYLLMSLRSNMRKQMQQTQREGEL